MSQEPATVEPPSRSAEILVVDDDAKTLVAIEAMLADLDATVVTAGSGRDALLKLLAHEYAVVLLDVQMPGLDGFETAEIIRGRDRTRHMPIIFLTAFNQGDRALLRGYGLGAVDFLFKPIVADILRSKVDVFVQLYRQKRELERQAELIREAEKREHARRLAEERQRWEADALREQMALERTQAEINARRAEELARAVGERDAAARALVRSNARLALLSDTANRLLVGQRPRVLLHEVCERVSRHLDLEVFAFRHLDGDELKLELYGGLSEEEARRFETLAVGEGMAGAAAARRTRVVADASQPQPLPEPMSTLGLTASVCIPLLAEERLIGTLGFGSRRRPRFTLEELATIQMVAEQIAIALEREALISELQSRNAALADADRRKDEFLAMLAHELRNPLAPIVNALHVIGSETAGRGGALERARKTMDRQVRHLIRLVEDLLDVSRITQGKIELRRERVELQAIIEQAVQIARPLVTAREHVLTLELPDEPLALVADATRLTQVIANLLNNAAKYTNRGGAITLRAERGDDEVVVRVRDNGIGIRSEMLPRIFELFVQSDRATDRAPGGLGLGLTLVKRLVQLHGGEVLARSDGLGRGSEFIVTVPLGMEAVESPESRVESCRTDPDADCGAPDAQLPTPNPGRTLKILVVEDNPDIRETLRDLLEIEGHEVTLAEDGPDGLEKAGNGARHDIAIVDIGLPGLDGYAVAERLNAIRRQKGSPARLIAMTGYGQAEDRRRAIEAGFDDHLVKPVDPETLTRLLAASAQEPVAHDHEGEA